MDKTSLGDRMKWYECRYAHQVMPMIPVIARVDGRSFSKFTKGLDRPYDDRMSELMVKVTIALVGETNARCGYTQSDEISLVWLAEDPDAEIFFGGKLAKMISVVGSLATVHFNNLLPDFLPERVDRLPVFDNRVWEVPVLYEAANYFVWREQDATRNSISMAARVFYSHDECHGKTSSEMQEMLFQKGQNWNDYPRHFKRGTYVRKQSVLGPVWTPEEIAALPPKHHAHQQPDLKVARTAIMEEDFPPLTQITNREEVLLFGADVEVSC
jgi:tRNA(His) 5'-end guanylyltransferase